jgi:hypothetical protein
MSHEPIDPAVPFYMRYYRPNQIAPPPGDRYIVIVQDDKQKRYRITKCGEIFEEKDNQK